MHKTPCSSATLADLEDPTIHRGGVDVEPVSGQGLAVQSDASLRQDAAGRFGVRGGQE